MKKDFTVLYPHIYSSGFTFFFIKINKHKKITENQPIKIPHVSL